MYITINDIIGEKKLTYLIQFALVGKSQLLPCLTTMFITRYWNFVWSWILFQTQKKMIPSRTYAGRELLSMLEGMVELNKFLVDDQVIKKNKLKGITDQSSDILQHSHNRPTGDIWLKF